MIKPRLLQILIAISWFWTFCGAHNHCNFNNFGVQSDFNITKFLGRWYLIKWKSHSDDGAKDLYMDYQHTYTLDNDDNITISIRGRNPGDVENCFLESGELIQTSEPGKLVYGRMIQDRVYESTDYWVTKTDYDTYAVVYGCRNRTQTVCLEADSWIFGRHQNHFTTQQMETIDIEIERLCLNTSDFLQTNQTMDCTPCTYTAAGVQNNFDLNRFLGKWYEIKWLPQSYIPPDQLYIDYQHNYSMKHDGEINGTVRGRDPANKDDCFQLHVELYRTATDGKLLYNRSISSTEFLTSDYIVTKTDYTRYAVVYGCREKNTTNSMCHAVDSWVWSRTKTLDQTSLDTADAELNRLCLNVSTFAVTEHSNDCSVTSEGSTIYSFIFLIFGSILMIFEAIHD